ncbi:MAG: hypothetical protein A2301_01455 [Candidatus Magasanikbacteria bacterium RIFOXYB2_FULL_40_13]|uniref:Uncharacterized protein n=1 Tax=Candidatus Magasanikbacteria bacterium RIFOXYA1_FULL_40_8 TaxID=1798694 RepID=A0A1F6NTV4_9BACT|nr:MAG: hypothetical protein A2224_02725 [Candidatus Magasanikbacteria bacterium RIFOXYA2_FULL_40_20]OGH86954.1 MAG: hypothetical protein A2301_01455 [Candidatus Magasanikbacteria bacterium RIFOXYB2_FULL_40_13]OGH87163.1 MAG: hypothetical protein A2206_01630 [Candidatus Magasanikbacteria bacterium RIFOXYA1_FULL_40_8]
MCIQGRAGDVQRLLVVLLGWGWWGFHLGGLLGATVLATAAIALPTTTAFSSAHDVHKYSFPMLLEHIDPILLR